MSVAVADFVFCIDFKKGEGLASSAFSATHEFIKAFERMDRELITSIDAKIEDDQWLKEFQDRKVNVRTGDALRCQV